MKILPLTGPKALKAFYSFHKLLLGLKMLPAYMGEAYSEFYEAFNEKTEAEKEKLVREAAVFVPLEQDELMALVSFASDKNGVPYCPENIKNLEVNQLFEIIVAVSMEIGKIKVDLISEDEKKNLATTPLT